MKGKVTYDSGVFYCPYIPLQMNKGNRMIDLPKELLEEIKQAESNQLITSAMIHADRGILILIHDDSTVKRNQIHEHIIETYPAVLVREINLKNIKSKVYTILEIASCITATLDDDNEFRSGIAQAAFKVLLEKYEKLTGESVEILTKARNSNFHLILAD